jgi:hypothetical protein
VTTAKLSEKVIPYVPVEYGAQVKQLDLPLATVIVLDDRREG